MKKRRKQGVNVNGMKQLVDVPDDDALYRADNREEYHRMRSNSKHVSLDSAIISGIVAADVAEIIEEAELLICLRETLRTLTREERQLIEYIYYNGLSEKETASILMVTRQTVNKKKHRIIKKLRSSLAGWIE
jgi:RNA polymerase sigma factor (sigma-70 family)